MGLSPPVFWAMSLAEWRAAVAGRQRRGRHAAPLDRGELQHLMELYPDG